ncbi:Aquaporin AQPAe.a [Blattella germanica]|nr:Aquaporin AQPAe.a [Blattella germanica]
MLITGNIAIIKGFLYIIAQCIGSLAGTAVLKAFTPNATQGKLGATELGEDVLPIQGFGVEFMLGFVLVIVVFGVCDANRPEFKGFAPLVIGLTITLGHLAALSYTGSSMNPARTLGSAVVSGIWSDHWVYWLGPILGGCSAGLLYKYVLSAAPVETTTEYSPVQVQVQDKEVTCQAFY